MESAPLLTILSTFFVQNYTGRRFRPWKLPIKQPDRLSAPFLFREIKPYQIKGIDKHIPPCAQSYQQNMGISWHNFCVGKRPISRTTALFLSFEIFPI